MTKRMIRFAMRAKLEGAIVAFQDVTSRKRAEEVSQKQAQRLRLLWEAAGVLLAAGPRASASLRLNSSGSR